VRGVADELAPRPVEVGEWAGEGWIVTAGLKAGERVIIDGVLKLGPGAPVKVAGIKVGKIENVEFLGGAMDEKEGRRVYVRVEAWIESWIFNSNKCFATFMP